MIKFIVGLLLAFVVFMLKRFLWEVASRMIVQFLPLFLEKNVNKKAPQQRKIQKDVYEII